MIECQMGKIAEYAVSRKQAAGYAAVVGTVIGIANVFLTPIDFILTPALIGWLAAAIVAVVLLHEGVHGAVAFALGHRPVFGFRPPLVYVTFEEKIPRGRFMAIALAPLVILDVAFASLFAAGILAVFSYFCLMINTIGATGDVWIVLKLARQRRGTLIQDTRTGIEVWENPAESRSCVPEGDKRE